MVIEPTEQHQWLQRLVGEWTCVAEWPGSHEGGSEGTESVRSLGGFWVVADNQVAMPCGGPSTMVISLGFDPDTNQYVGTWIGSMMARLWVYNGELSPEGNTLTLASEGPDMFEEGKTGLYHDVIEFQDDDHRTLSGRVLREDGTWHEFMIIRYQRVK